MRTGFTELPLHTGRAPAWLFSRMAKLARGVVSHVVEEYGAEDMLQRLSNPFWFQAFGCVLGFDWHSSGVTTTTCGAVKEGLKGLEQELGIVVAGGKGGIGRRTPQEIARACEQLSQDPSPYIYASRMSAKVDSAAIQDGYQIYHHAFFFTKTGRWCVVQQGMNEQTGLARRYHWLGERVTNFVDEPHSAICCDVRGPVMDFTAQQSVGARQAATELIRQPFDITLTELQRLPSLRLPKRHQVMLKDLDSRYLRTILLKTYERAPQDFESLLGIEGVGPKTLRALALVAELVYDSPVSTRDPARFAFAHGGKDGTPFPVDRATYDETVAILDRALQRAKVEPSVKDGGLKRLAAWAKNLERSLPHADT
ncbi:MAG: DUF763 domain-containing protein [Nitrospirae bacterium]|nr:MAG: DUF763 domain-containing protein [Nitrospirota bacterium]